MLPRFLCCSLLVSLTLNACAGEEDTPTRETSTGAASQSAGASGMPRAGASGVPDPGAAGSDGAGAAGGQGDGGAGGQAGGDASGPFAVEVVSFTPGTGAGFGQEQMPEVVFGAPEGGGTVQGGLDVVSLGVGGEITLRLGVDVVDGPGADFIVFENPFFHGAQQSKIWAEPGEVSVSEDGQSWTPFPCDPDQLEATHCAGWRPVFSSSTSGISPFDLSAAGGDPFDLATVGVVRARYVRIRDVSQILAPPTAGFDLDAVAVIHAAP
jgi:hypothetical protein